MTGASDDPLLFTFFNEIGIINQLAATQFERALPDGLTLPQFSVLNHFARLGGERTPAELARAFQVTKGAMTNTLRRLEGRDLVRVRVNPEDGRSKLVTITAKGRRMRDKAVAALAPAFEDFARLVSPGKVKQVLPTLQYVRATLDRARD